MNRLPLFALPCLLALAAAALQAADEEPAIRPDPRPTDLTTGRRGSNDEPAIRSDRRAVDVSISRIEGGGAILPRKQISGLTADQSDRIRLIHEKASADIQAIHDRERAEIMTILNAQQRAEFNQNEDQRDGERPRRATTTPATTQSTL